MWYKKCSSSGFIYSVAISSNGSYIAVGSSDKNIYLFKKDSPTPVWNYTAEWAFNSVAISFDGSYCVASSSTIFGSINGTPPPPEGEVYLFDKDNSKPIWHYDISNYITSVAISNDGKHVAVGSYDDKVYLF